MVLSGRFLSLALRLTVGAGLATLIACGMASSDATAGFSNEKPGEGTGADGGLSPSGPNDKADSGQGAPTGSGIVLVHAAAFPSFRLCFSNHLDLKPQPESKVMPEANVVGVEVGSVVRINGLTAPGKVYVINRKYAPASPNSVEPTCRQLVSPTPTGSLEPNNEYIEAGELKDDIGLKSVAALAITGCGHISAVANIPGFDYANRCGTDWKQLSGSLMARPLVLSPATAGNGKLLPIQVAHFAPFLDVSKGSGVVEVTFGKLSDPPNAALGQTVELPALFGAGAQKNLTVDETPSFYGENGFRIAVRPSGNGAPSFTKNISLARVQELSSPSDVPSSYYKAASNYAVLLLGDPAMKEDAEDFDERRSVHIVTVPILEPNADEPDAGAGDDAGDGG